MGNSAGKAFRLGWLICAIEGEGNISLTWSKHGHKKHIQLAPRVAVTNKDRLFIEQCVDISKEINVGCYVNWSNKGIGKVTWQGVKRVNSLIKALGVTSFLGKQGRAKLLLEWTENRLDFKGKYNQYDKECFLKMRELNGKGRTSQQFLKLNFETKSPETTRQTPARDEDIVRPHVKA